MRYHAPIDPDCPEVARFVSALFDDPMTQAMGAPCDDIIEGFTWKIEPGDEWLKPDALRGLWLLAGVTAGELLSQKATASCAPDVASSTASSTARQKSQTAMMARRCSAGSTRKA